MSSRDREETGDSKHQHFLVVLKSDLEKWRGDQKPCSQKRGFRLTWEKLQCLYYASGSDLVERGKLMEARTTRHSWVEEGYGAWSMRRASPLGVWVVCPRNRRKASMCAQMKVGWWIWKFLCFCFLGEMAGGRGKITSLMTIWGREGRGLRKVKCEVAPSRVARKWLIYLLL